MENACTGHPESVDALLKFDEDTLLTGSSDGLIRLVSVLPNRLLATVGEHGSDPVEALALAPGRACLASASHDERVKIWGLGPLLEEDDEDEDGEDGHEEVPEAQEAAATAGVGSDGDRKGQQQHGDGNAGQQQQQRRQRDGGSSSDDGGGSGKPRRKRGKKGEHKIHGKTQAKQASFFSGLM